MTFNTLFNYQYVLLSLTGGNQLFMSTEAWGKYEMRVTLRNTCCYLLCSNKRRFVIQKYY